MASLILVGSMTGCSILGKPSRELAFDESAALQGSDSAEVYQRIRQAKTQNAVVVQVADDSQPIRILPLPADGRSVFVSDLLKQTGVQDKLGRMLVTVYRSSPVDYAGAKMVVKFEDKGDAVRPETDYALQAGDRIKIAKDTSTAIGGIFDQILPSNGSRAIVGF